MMNRQEKQALIETLRSEFSAYPSSFLVQVKGLTVVQMQALRRGVRQHGGKFRVAKNTLARCATSDLAYANELNPYLKEQVAIVFAPQDSTAVAKVLCDYAKEYECLSIMAGCFESRVISKETVQKLGTLPSREVLMARLCGVLKGPIAKCAIVLKQVAEKIQAS